MCGSHGDHNEPMAAALTFFFRFRFLSFFLPELRLAFRVAASTFQQKVFFFFNENAECESSDVKYPARDFEQFCAT